MTVSLQNDQFRRVRTTPLRQAVLRLLRAEGHDRAEVSVLLIDDSAMQVMNRDFRGKDKPTDVLSFAQHEPAEGAPLPPPIPGVAPLLGDVVISVDTAVRQAREHNIPIEQELALLAVHGVLHLIGYEDETEAGAARMRDREQEILGVALVGVAH